MTSTNLFDKIDNLVSEFTDSYIDIIKSDSRLTTESKHESHELALKILSKHLESHSLRSDSPLFGRLHLEHGMHPENIFLIYEKKLKLKLSKINFSRYFRAPREQRLSTIREFD